MRSHPLESHSGASCINSNDATDELPLPMPLARLDLTWDFDRVSKPGCAHVRSRDAKRRWKWAAVRQDGVG